ncbi:MAG: hypothetical protein RL033_3638, partial [Pseudomonadota bacterium]
MSAPQPLDLRKTAVRRPVFGRAREQSLLREALSEVTNGRGGLWLLSGEPGIGKTTLAGDVERQAREQGCLVVWGRAWQAGGAPAFWPWSEALSVLVNAQAEPRALADAQTAAIAHLLPEHFGPPLAAPVASAEEARFALFLAVRTLLTRAARAQPIVLLFDDLHAADRSSLLLLEFIGPSLPSLPILVLGTYRDVEARLDPEMGRLIVQLARLGVTLPLGRLETRAATELAQAEVPGLQGSRLERLLATAQGNPLFLDQLLRHIQADPEALGQQASALPAVVQQVIRDRLALLPRPMQEVLEAGAVVGDEFEPELVAEICGSDAPLLDAVVERGAAAGVLAQLDGGRLRFTHALYREVLYRELPLSRRASLHAAVLRAIEGRHAGAPHPPLAELSHHALCAGPESLGAAVAYSISAAEVCFAQLAYDDALSLLERARSLVDRLAGPLPLRGSVLLAQGQLQMRTGATALGQALCAQAAEIGERSGDAELLARAALGYGSVLRAGLIDAVLVDLLSRALVQLGDAQPLLRVSVMARLAAARHPVHDFAESLALARDAITLARQLGDGVTLLSVLYTSLSVMADCVDPLERIPLNRECAALALELGDRQKRLRSFSRLVFDHVELGEFATAAEYIDDYDRLAAELQLQHVLWRAPVFRSMLALAQGDFAAVARYREQAKLLAGVDAEAGRCLLTQQYGVWTAQERLSELGACIEADSYRMLGELGAAQSAFAPGLCAWVASRREDTETARRYWSRIPT